MHKAFEKAGLKDFSKNFTEKSKANSYFGRNPFQNLTANSVAVILHESISLRSSVKILVNKPSLLKVISPSGH
ncbi:MAG: hypothetical protein D6687_02715 [Acidobacteria bacterium]|jgi:hypothetical protein|nr:MAG: hypothetical protein D6687_02715 [Acidobacteriota bacterium]